MKMIEGMKTPMLVKLLKGDAVLLSELLALLDSRKKVQFLKKISKTKTEYFKGF